MWWRKKPNKEVIPPATYVPKPKTPEDIAKLKYLNDLHERALELEQGPLAGSHGGLPLGPSTVLMMLMLIDKGILSEDVFDDLRKYFDEVDKRWY